MCPPHIGNLSVFLMSEISASPLPLPSLVWRVFGIKSHFNLDLQLDCRYLSHVDFFSNLIFGSHLNCLCFKARSFLKNWALYLFPKISIASDSQGKIVANVNRLFSLWKDAPGCWPTFLQYELYLRLGEMSASLRDTLAGFSGMPLAYQCNIFAANWTQRKYQSKYQIVHLTAWSNIAVISASCHYWLLATLYISAGKRIIF